LRRLRFIKFDQIPAKKDLNLKKAVATEGSGILNLILGVIPELLALNGLPEGSSGSEMSHERFKIANDPVGTFVATECTLDRELSENKDALKARFDKFLEHHGLSEKTVHIFFKQLYERFPVDPVRMRVGLEREQRITGITLIPVTESRL